MNTIMIITGESSGELYGSLLAETLRKRFPHLLIMGVGGDRMGKAGVELISRISGAFGLTELFSALRGLRRAFKKTKEALKTSMPQVLVLIDFPDFNIKVAEFAKSLGIKILYYVSPQVWAWRKSRVKKIARLVDRMAVILPFEPEIYRRENVQCEFVGHPVVEEMEAVLQTMSTPVPFFSEKGSAMINPELRAPYKHFLGFSASRPLLSLLPGSRPSELKRHLPQFVEVVMRFKREFKDYQFCIPLALNTEEMRYRDYIEALKLEGALITRGESIQALAASDIAVVASGTATLQAALLEVPMVVIYKLSPLSYFLGKRLIHIEHISLINILSGKGLVPELIQQKANPGSIIGELKKIISDPVYQEEMVRQYRLIRKPFLNLRPSQRVTEIIGEMTGWELQKQ